MTKAIHLAAVLVALSAYGTAAPAQTVYRCADSYSNKPCPGATVVSADDPRSQEQRDQTRAAAERDARSAAVMESERLKQEAILERSNIPAARPAGPAAARTGSTTASNKPGIFKAVAPPAPGDKAPKVKKKAASKPAARKKPG